MIKKKYLTLIIDKNYTWNLPLWEKTIPYLLRNNFTIKHIIICEEILSDLKGINLIKWYFSTFGIFIFFKLSLFSLIKIIKRNIGFIFGLNFLNFSQLSRKYNIELIKCSNPNNKAIVKRLNSSNIDIILITTSHKINDQIINIPNISIINKHSSALPSNKGLFPYLWAIINNSMQGVSFHLVNSKIDNGQILYQNLEFPDYSLRSMVSFYNYIFENYPTWVTCAIKNLTKFEFTKPKKGLKDTYYGLPSKEDVKLFKSFGGKVIIFQDIIKLFKIYK